MLEKGNIQIGIYYDYNNSESFFRDDEGSKWSIFGKAIEGSRKGELLNASN